MNMNMNIKMHFHHVYEENKIKKVLNQEIWKTFIKCDKLSQPTTFAENYMAQIKYVNLTNSIIRKFD